MALEKASALVLRTTDWSETSRIATLWTREFGKVRALAKGGRRLKSNFESALDLLTLCSIVLLRKTSGSLDLLTEAQVWERFGQLRGDLPSLYAAYYVAELLSDWTEEYDPHPVLFDEAVATLRILGTPGVFTGPRLVRFELVMLRELGYHPVLENCVACGLPAEAKELGFSSAAGGIVCSSCRQKLRGTISLSPAGRQALLALLCTEEACRREWPISVRKEMRQVLDDYVTYLMGRRPRMLSYLGS